MISASQPINQSKSLGKSKPSATNKITIEEEKNQVHEDDGTKNKTEESKPVHLGDHVFTVTKVLMLAN
jgi:hypothetical protein